MLTKPNSNTSTENIILDTRSLVVSRIDLQNATDLSDARLLRLCEEGLADWSVGTMKLRVRFSRGADFSGTCFYADRRVYVNLGRHLAYPYRLGTHIARAKTIGKCWFKPAYTVELDSGYEVVLFVFLHELYHLLVRRAKRNTRQKESMCDRFAARHLVDRFGRTVCDEKGRPVPREVWDFQDVDGFVAAASRRPARRSCVLGVRSSPKPRNEQLLLFLT